MDNMLRGAEVCDTPMMDESDQSIELRTVPGHGDQGTEQGTMDHHLGRKPFAVRMRMILLLSLLCWAALLAALVSILA